MTRSPEARCETCVYWNYIRHNDGECRRQSPRVDACGEWTAWPATGGQHWCGEHPAFAKLRTPHRQRSPR
jgi:hypothetical protein